MKRLFLVSVFALLFSVGSAYSALFYVGLHIHSSPDDNRAFGVHWNDDGLGIVQCVDGYGYYHLINYDSRNFYSVPHTVGTYLVVRADSIDYIDGYITENIICNAAGSFIDAANGEITLGALENTALDIHVYVNGAVDPHDPPVDGTVPIMDEYRYVIYVSNDDPLYNVTTESWLNWGNGFEVVDAQHVIYEGQFVDIEGSVWAERDSDDPRPVSVQTQCHYGRDDLVSVYDENFGLMPTGEKTDTGGDVWFADIQMLYHYDLPADPDDPIVIDPPDPTDPENPLPDAPGGDTSPSVPLNYASFRDAMEDALDNRELSGEEIHDAVESALGDQGLSGENIQTAMENALENRGWSPEQMAVAVASGTADGNDQLESLLGEVFMELSQFHDDMNAKTNSTGDAETLAALGEISDKLGDGTSPGSGVSTNLPVFGEYDITNSIPDVSGSSGAAIVKASEFMDFMDDWWGSFFELNLPESIGQTTVVTFNIPGTMPPGSFSGVSILEISGADFGLLEIDIADFGDGLGIIRALEVLLLNIFGIYKAAQVAHKIYGG